MPGEYRLVGYLADWNDWTAERIDAEKMTHLNYAFAKISGDTVHLDSPDKLAEFKKLKKKHPALQTLISIGGWGADGFSDAALTDESRRRFAENAVSLMLDDGFDGLDLDWEYPCSSEAGITSRPEDKWNFTRLLQTLRQKLDWVGGKENRHYLLTAATGATEEYAVGVELVEMAAFLDFINIMTYDLTNGFSTTIGHHANLYPSPLSPGNLSADFAVREHLKAGIPASKINLGCALYGRGWLAESPVNHGLYQPAVKDSHDVYPYRILAAEYIDKNTYRRFWDDTAKAPYLWNGTRFISYEDPESLDWKVRYIKTMGLGGAMFWEYNLDKSQRLLNNLHAGLNSQ